MRNNNYINLLFFLSLLIASFSYFFLEFFGTGELAIRFLIQCTAKISMLCFATAFGAAAFQYFFKDPISRTALKYRPHIGLTFGVFHSAHLFFLIWLQQSIHPVFTLANKFSLIAGGSAYILMYLMMLTTFPYFKSKINAKSWNTLHLVGSYWIWTIFFNSYLKRVRFKEEGYLFFGILVLVFVLRLLHLKLRRDEFRKGTRSL